MKTTTAITAIALLCAGCFADVGPVEGDSSDDTDAGTTTATDSATSAGTGGQTSGAATDSGSTGAVSSTTSTATTEGSTGSTGTTGITGDATGSTGGMGSTGGGSTGATGAGLYEACVEDSDCESGTCAPPFGPASPEVTGFCSVPCAGFGDPCPDSPFAGWDALCDEWPNGGPYLCGIRCIGTSGCPAGWACKTYLDEFVHPICFEEV